MLLAGFFPYITKLLQGSTPDLRVSLTHIWSHVLSTDVSTRDDLIKENALPFFVTVLADVELDVETRCRAAHVISVIAANNPPGQQAALGTALPLCLELVIDSPGPLRLWLCVCMHRLWNNFDQARASAHRDNVVDKLSAPLRDQSADVRAAAVCALRSLLGSADRSQPTITSEQHAADALLRVVLDGSPLVRRELVYTFVRFAQLFGARMRQAFRDQSSQPSSGSGQRQQAQTVFDKVVVGMVGMLSSDAVSQVAAAARTFRELIEPVPREHSDGKTNRGQAAALTPGESTGPGASAAEWFDLCKWLEERYMQPPATARDHVLVGSAAGMDEKEDQGGMPYVSSAASLVSMTGDGARSVTAAFGPTLGAAAADGGSSSASTPGAKVPHSASVNSVVGGAAAIGSADAGDVFGNEEGEWECARDQYCEAELAEMRGRTRKSFRRMVDKVRVDHLVVANRTLDQQTGIVEASPLVPSVVRFLVPESRLLVSDATGNVQIWNWVDGSLSRRICILDTTNGARMNGLQCLNEDDPSPLLAVASSDGAVRIWTGLGEERVRMLTGWTAVPERKSMINSLVCLCVCVYVSVCVCVCLFLSICLFVHKSLSFYHSHSLAPWLAFSVA
jgi:hypothetical protein